MAKRKNTQNNERNTIITILFVIAIIALLLLIARKADEQANVVDLPVVTAGPTTDAATNVTDPPAPTQITLPDYDLSDIPDASRYKGKSAYVLINNNVPYFSDDEKQVRNAFELYSPLDELGRCGTAYANVCAEIMPTEPREAIGSVKPSGWQTVKYDIVDGKYLYNRCHLIGFQLAGENANPLNLITGTRYFNTKGMLPFENMTADAVKNDHLHVLYRVTPIFRNNNLVADGVLIEGWSVEDAGETVSFCVFVLNIQPGITIDYKTGKSKLND